MEVKGLVDPEHASDKILAFEHKLRQTVIDAEADGLKVDLAMIGVVKETGTDHGGVINAHKGNHRDFAYNMSSVLKYLEEEYEEEYEHICNNMFSIVASYFVNREDDIYDIITTKIEAVVMASEEDDQDFLGLLLQLKKLMHIKQELVDLIDLVHNAEITIKANLDLAAKSKD